MKQLNTCGEYHEDSAICDSLGEPKGQCVHCGDKWYAHRNEALPPEELDARLNEIRTHNGYEQEPISVWSEDERRDIETTVDIVGFDGTFASYSLFEEIKDVRFHQLRKKYLAARTELREYIEHETTP